MNALKCKKAERGEIGRELASRRSILGGYADWHNEDAETAEDGCNFANDFCLHVSNRERLTVSQLYVRTTACRTFMINRM